MLVVGLVCIGATFAGVAPASVAVVALALVALTIGVGVSVPSSGVFARPVLGARTERRALALTFDDGPDPQWTPPLLDMLDAGGHRATFFLIGERAERYPAVVADIARRGHEVANHTWAHSFTTVFTAPRRLAKELQRANDVIERSAGMRPRWFRPPVGLLSPRIPLAVDAAGLQLVAWTSTARDGVGSATVNDAFARLAGSIAPGAVLVLHDARLRDSREPIARELLRRVLDRMDSAGLKSVTLSELCPASVPAPVYPGSGGDARTSDRAEEETKRESADRPRH